ncbi:MAG: oxalate/formate MFS antiporter [Firmicutes bacterium]|nr:oxalate/formate MFS antiporter [Bacillota bacterium]
MQVQTQGSVMDPKEVYGPFFGNRWIQLTFAVLGMVMIANLQYAWTLFVPPLRQAFGWSLPAVQLGFTLFILFETYTQPIEGFLLDRFGPRVFFTVAGVLVGIGWTALGYVKTLPALYFFYGLAGLGAGFVYGGSIATAVRWFPDKRGLASGIIAAGFGAGSAPFIPFIGRMLEHQGYATAFQYTGILQGLVILVVAQILRNPPGTNHASHAAQNKARPEGKRGFAPWEMLKTPHFWLIYLMFIFMATGGLLVTAQTKPFAKDIGIASSIVILAVTVDRLSNGLGRVTWGWVSDRIGRETTMVIAYTLNAVFVFLMPILGHNPVMFIALVFFIMFTWGEIFSLFPSVTADRFGTTYAASNYGFVYSAKGIGGILGGYVAALLAQKAGWTTVFDVAALMAFLAGMGALILNRMPKPVLPEAKTGGGITTQG